MNSELPIYNRTDGTVIIAGDTDPTKAGRCAAYFFKKNQFPIDFLCIGVEANQQAMKAMGFFRSLLLEARLNIDVSFVPLRFTTITTDENKLEEAKDCTAWRSIFNIQQDKDSTYEIQRSVKIVV